MLRLLPIFIFSLLVINCEKEAQKPANVSKPASTQTSQTIKSESSDEKSATAKENKVDSTATTTEKSATETKTQTGRVSGRWYTYEMVAEGKNLYSKNCLSCHLNEGKGSPMWQSGPFPPPLNSTGHTFHHPISVLRAQITEGSLAKGGQMPPFGPKIGPDGINSLLAYINSLWPEKVYSQWVASGALYN